MDQLTFGKLERPVAESKYIVRVKAKELNWRNFLYFSGMPIFPAHVLKTVNGDEYLKEYNFKLLPGSGPYIDSTRATSSKGQSITVRRRKDYWAEKARANVGLNNFDELQLRGGSRREPGVRDVQEGRTRLLYVVTHRGNGWKS